MPRTIPPESPSATALPLPDRWRAASTRRPGLVLLVWLATSAAVWVGAISADGSPSDEISVSGSDSAAAIDLAERTEFFNGLGLSARVVLQAEDGPITSPENRAVVVAGLTALVSSDGATAIDDPFDDRHVSSDGTVAYTEIRYEAEPPDEADYERLRRIAAGMTRQGVRTEVGGTLADSVADP